MDESYNEYILKWRDTILKAAKCLQENNYIEYENLMDKANELYEKYKDDSELTYECYNFGMANYIFEDALPKLFKKNRIAIKEFINTIKEDKNLLSQFKLYKALESYNKELNPEEYINESFELAKKDINVKTLNESNNKLFSIINKYGIKPSDKITDDKLRFFESCDFLFKNNKKITNLNEINLSLKQVTDFTKENYNKENLKKTNVYGLMEEFERKYKNSLNESEKSLVKDIMAAKTEANTKKKENIFNTLKNECLDHIDTLLKESNENERNELLKIKEQINSKIFCEESLIKDVARLIEIKDILSN